MATSLQNARFFQCDQERAASSGDAEACFDLGMNRSSGDEMDLIEAHKWFNLAALHGHDEASHWRGEVADEMTAREIAEAQRRARAILHQTRRLAA